MITPKYEFLISLAFFFFFYSGGFFFFENKEQGLAVLFCTRFSVFLFFVFLHFFVAGVWYWYCTCTAYCTVQYQCSLGRERGKKEKGKNSSGGFFVTGDCCGTIPI